MLSFFSRAQARELVLIAGPALLVVLGAFYLAFQFVEPAPPSVVRISSGSSGGGYYAFAQKYARVLKRAGIEGQVLTSAGSVENIMRLGDDAHRADIALLQGGIATSMQQAGRPRPELVSLGRVFPEPLWIFYSGGGRYERLVELKGRRLAIGAVGSGTRILSEAILEPNGITAANTTFVALGGRAAAEALRNGTVDAAFLALSPEAPLVAELLREDGLQLMSLKRAEAYTRLFPYLTRVTLPAGVVDLVKGIPQDDVQMLAAQAAVVARADTHPAIISLMVEALKEVHGGGGMFQRIDEFPKSFDPEFSLSDEARRAYQEGPSFLKRYLPFWLASFIERTIVMAVPIATILIPLVKIVPWIYETRIKSRIFHWFQELRILEKKLDEASDRADNEPFLEEIAEIDRAVNNIPIPWHYQDRYYELKAAVDLVWQRIETRSRRAAQPVSG